MLHASMQAAKATAEEEAQAAKKDNTLSKEIAAVEKQLADLKKRSAEQQVIESLHAVFA